jgi:hypothetical protein
MELLLFYLSDNLKFYIEQKILRKPRLRRMKISICTHLSHARRDGLYSDLEPLGQEIPAPCRTCQIRTLMPETPHIVLNQVFVVILQIADLCVSPCTSP